MARGFGCNSRTRRLIYTGLRFLQKQPNAKWIYRAPQIQLQCPFSQQEAVSDRSGQKKKGFRVNHLLGNSAFQSKHAYQVLVINKLAQRKREVFSHIHTMPVTWWLCLWKARWGQQLPWSLWEVNIRSILRIDICTRKKTAPQKTGFVKRSYMRNPIKR